MTFGIIEVVLVLALVLAIGIAVYSRTNAGKAELATIRGDVAAAHAKFDAFVAGFHLGAAQPSTAIVDAPVPVPAPAPAPPVVAPPPGQVTITGHPSSITDLLFPQKPTAPTVLPPVQPVLVLDPNVIHYFHPIEVSAASPVYKKTDPLTGPTEVLCAYMASDGAPTSELQVWFCGDFPIPMPPDTPKGNISADWSIPIPSAGYVGFLANGSARFSAQLQRTA